MRRSQPRPGRQKFNCQRTKNQQNFNKITRYAAVYNFSDRSNYARMINPQKEKEKEIQRYV